MILSLHFWQNQVLSSDGLFRPHSIQSSFGFIINFNNKYILNINVKENWKYYFFFFNSFSILLDLYHSQKIRKNPINNKPAAKFKRFAYRKEEPDMARVIPK